ncbi:MAG: hypothetical protein WCO98_09530 [bacterium]
MSITCSRCQAENNDVKYACWNCWAVLPRQLSEEDLLAEATKGKGNKKTSPIIEPLQDETLDVTAIIPPQPEQKKGGLFGGLGKKKVTEQPAPAEELTDMFADFAESEKVDTATAAAITENEDIFAPLSDNVESPETVEIVPEPVKEKKGLFGFGSKKPVVPAVTPEDTSIAPVKGEISKPEKKPLLSFGKNKSSIVEPVQSAEPDASEVQPVISEIIIPDISPIVPDSAVPDISPVVPETQPVSTAPVINNEPILSSSEIINIEPSNDTTPAETISTASTIEQEVPFDFDFKAEVEKVFGGTNQDSTKPATPQPNRPKRIRPVREEDGGLKRPKRPQ